MHQLAKHNRVASAVPDRQQDAFDGNGDAHRTSETKPGSIDAFKPIFIGAPEFAVQINGKTDSIAANERGMLSIFGIKDNHWRKIPQLWKSVRRRISNRILENANEAAQVFCGNTFRKEDVLIVSGVIQLIIGVGTLLAGSIAYLEEQEKQVCPIVCQENAH